MAADPALLGLDAIIIGRQVPTAHRNFIDLLALDRSGGIIIIELKRDRTPRDVVAQTLDYASWVRSLTTPEVYAIAEKFNEQRLSTRFQEHFDEAIPERLNGSHSMLIVAGQLDPTSRRIVEYLSEEHDVAINTAFFNVFRDGDQEWLTTDFLLDQAEVEERSERKVRPPWSGFYFVNAGHGAHRSWADMMQYGFISAGGGRFYSGRLDQLNPGDKIFAYVKGEGYVGHGTVTSAKQPAATFQTSGGPLFEQPLDQPEVKHDADDPDLAEYVVGIAWKDIKNINDARTFKGVFANQNVVCKLRDPATVDFLLREFDVDDE